MKKTILKKIALSVLPIVVIISLVMFINEIISYVPTNIYTSIAHTYYGLFGLIAFCIIFLYVVSILLIWFSSRFQWYIDVLNILSFILLVGMGIVKIDDYKYHKKHEQLEQTLVNIEFNN